MQIKLPSCTGGSRQRKSCGDFRRGARDGGDSRGARAAHALSRHRLCPLRNGDIAAGLASRLYALDKDGTATRVSPAQDFMGFSPDPAEAMSYYASGHPAGGGNSGFLHSADGGATWKQLSPGWMARWTSIRWM